MANLTEYKDRREMASCSSSVSLSNFLPNRVLSIPSQNQNNPIILTNPKQSIIKRRISFRVLAAKAPSGVEFPKVEPTFKAPFAGFTKTAEIWNSRACMIGLIGTFIVELIINKGILQVLGVDIGKGLDIPL